MLDGAGAYECRRAVSSVSPRAEMSLPPRRSSIIRIFRDRRLPSALAFACMRRTYVPHEEKHKWPKGFGSLCPHMPAAEPGQLLNTAIPVPGVGASKLWAASGRWCFCALPSPHAGADAWHGFPVIGGDVDERVLIALHRDGPITRRQMKQLRAQRELPEAWP